MVLAAAAMIQLSSGCGCGLWGISSPWVLSHYPEHLHHGDRLHKVVTAISQRLHGNIEEIESKGLICYDITLLN